MGFDDSESENFLDSAINRTHEISLAECIFTFFKLLITANTLKSMIETRCQRRNIRDKRNWKDRISFAHSAWVAQLPDLVMAFLAWKHKQHELQNASATHTFQVQAIGIRGMFFFAFFKRFFF
jgi:hypothetical protein